MINLKRKIIKGNLMNLKRKIIKGNLMNIKMKKDYEEYQGGNFALIKNSHLISISVFTKMWSEVKLLIVNNLNRVLKHCIKVSAAGT